MAMLYVGGTSEVREVYGGEHRRDFEILATTAGHSSVVAFSVRTFVSIWVALAIELNAWLYLGIGSRYSGSIPAVLAPFRHYQWLCLRHFSQEYFIVWFVGIRQYQEDVYPDIYHRFVAVT
jgi:hypothetical protein